MKYLATVRDVREVVLLGRADLGYWRDHLASSGLQPRTVADSAEVMLGAFRSRWMGLPFGEAIVGVSVEDEVEPGREAFYLLQGYNTNRFFAFVERVRFRTPYRRARVELRIDNDVGFTLDGGPGHVVRASTRSDLLAGEPVHEAFEGRVYLPGTPRRHYFASLDGERVQCEADPSKDALTLDAQRGDGALACLVESGFAPTTWQVGQGATHARSGTIVG